MFTKDVSVRRLPASPGPSMRWSGAWWRSTGVYLMRGTRATWVLADMARDAHELVVRLEPRRVPARRDLADMAVPANALVRGASSLQKDASVPDMFAPSTVRRIAALATPTRGVQAVALATYNGSVSAAVELTDAVHEHAEAAVAPFEVTYGSVVGKVSRLSDRRALSRGDATAFVSRAPLKVDPIKPERGNA